MLLEFLDSLLCPYCGSDFEIGAVIQKKGDEIIAGFVKCECSEFPILSGILILKDSSINNKIIRLIKEANLEEATTLYLCCEDFERINHFGINNALFLPIPLKARRLVEKITSTLVRVKEEKTCRKLHKKYSDKSVSFHKLLGRSFYETYLKHRFSAESLWSLYPFIPLIKNKKERILDLCCGVGYSSFFLSDYVEAKQLCCADIVFRRLYLNKKYFATRAQFVCFDANYPLPFRADFFSSILMLDAFGYIRSRALLARELERVLFSDGLVLFLHIHNSYAFNLGGGTSITPKELVNLFSNGCFATKVMPERKILTNFLYKDKLDLREECSKEEINSSNALILLATHDKSVFKIYEEVTRDFLIVKNHLIINPIYEMKRKDSNFLLKRPLSKYALGDIYPFSEKYLPKEFEISGNLLIGREVKSTNIDKVENLMKRFIIVNVPENYI